MDASRFQYQQYAEPLVTQAAPTAPELSWKSQYPDRIDRLSVRAADQFFFATGATSSAFPVSDFAWRPIVPDWIWRNTLQTAEMQSFAFSNSRGLEISAWAIYPDWIARSVLPVAAMPTLALEPFPRPPAALLSAWGWLPDRIDRLLFPAAQQQALGFYPFPYPPTNLLQAWGDYPAWIAHKVLPTALQSSFARNPVEPIPVPRGGRDKIFFGQVDAIDSPINVNIGGAPYGVF